MRQLPVHISASSSPQDTTFGGVVEELFTSSRPAYSPISSAELSPQKSPQRESSSALSRHASGGSTPEGIELGDQPPPPSSSSSRPEPVEDSPASPERVQEFSTPPASPVKAHEGNQQEVLETGELQPEQQAEHEQQARYENPFEDPRVGMPLDPVDDG